MRQKNLTPAERACLLRAARRVRREMEEELERLDGLKMRHVKGADSAEEMVQIEYSCLVRAIEWLWIEPIRAESPPDEPKE